MRIFKVVEPNSNTQRVTLHKDLKDKNGNYFHPLPCPNSEPRKQVEKAISSNHLIKMRGQLLKDHKSTSQKENLVPSKVKRMKKKGSRKNYSIPIMSNNFDSYD